MIVEEKQGVASPKRLNVRPMGLLNLTVRTPKNGPRSETREYNVPCSPYEDINEVGRLSQFLIPSPAYLRQQC